MKRSSRDVVDSDPGPSQKKRRTTGSEEEEGKKSSKKREREKSLEEQQVQDESCREEKRKRQESDEVGDPVRPPAQTSRPDPLIISNYSFFSVLGEGGFGKVMLGKLGDAEPYVAIKSIRKTKKTNYNSIDIEARVLKIARECPFLCRGLAHFQSQRHAFFVLEFLSGGSLEDELERLGKLPMERIVFHSAEMICGLQFLHGKGIIHRDIKPQNILLDHEGHVRISDFGLAELNILGDNTTTGWAGTQGYVAPEIQQEKPYNAAVDWWSFGITICEMATGKSPFDRNYSRELRRAIDSCPSLDLPKWPALLDLLKKLLIENPEERIGVQGDIRSHSFFKSIDWVALEEKRAQPPFQPEAPPAKLFRPYNGKPSCLQTEKDQNYTVELLICTILLAGVGNIFESMRFLGNIRFWNPEGQYLIWAHDR
uniref:Protein kinase domain-containing protein n=1 Tax=Xenopus tropicalis TaxID=8364 RepID=A0A1B8XUL0_XENTR